MLRGNREEEKERGYVDCYKWVENISYLYIIKKLQRELKIEMEDMYGWQQMALKSEILSLDLFFSIILSKLVRISYNLLFTYQTILMPTFSIFVLLSYKSWNQLHMILYFFFKNEQAFLQRKKMNKLFLWIGS